MLNESRSRDELEQVALKWEYSLMLRLIGPHQGIRLERLRAELDDQFEKYETTFEYAGEDQTQLVEKAIPEIHSTVETVTPVAMTPIPEVEVPPIQEQVAYSEPIAPLAAEGPTASTPGTVGNDGYEWLTHNDHNYYRLANTGAEWTIWQG